MKTLLSILQGSLAAGTGVLSCGWILLGVLRLRLRGAERWVAALALGAPLYALAASALAAAGWARRGVLTVLPAALAAAAWLLARRAPREAAPPGAPWPWKAAGVAVLAPFAVLAVLAALAPNLTPAAEDAALAQAARLAETPSSIPLSEWHPAAPLWLAAFAAGRHSAAATLHLLFLFGAAGLVFAALRRTASAPAAGCGAALTFTCPALLLPATQSGGALLFTFLAAGALFLFALGLLTRQPWLAGSALVPAAYAALLPLPAGNAYAGFLFRPLAPWPALIPLAAFALAWFMRRHAGWLAALTLFCAVTSWPPVLRRLAPAEARVLRGIRLSEVLRRTPEDSFLERRLEGYVAVRVFELALPREARVLSATPLPHSRIARAVTASPRLLELLRLPLDAAREPSLLRTVKARAVDVTAFDVKTRGAAEIRFYHAGAELPRRASWRVSAPEAFDNNPATIAAGRIDIDFGRPVTFDEVRILGLEGVPVPRPAGLRRYAMLALRRAGVTHVIVASDDEICTDLRRYGDFWGVRELRAGGVGGHEAVLFEIR